MSLGVELQKNQQVQEVFVTSHLLDSQGKHISCLQAEEICHPFQVLLVRMLGKKRTDRYKKNTKKHD